jgi:4-carboxymuconolactone decarboxylase
MYSERYEKGLQTRREVLGSEYVDKSLAAADEFTQEMQDFASSRPGAWSGPDLGSSARPEAW